MSPVAAPRSLRTAGLLVGLQGLVVLAFAGYYLEELARGRAETAGPAALTAAFLVVVAVALGLLARAVARARSWGRSPVVALELVHLPVLWYGTLAGRGALTLPLLAVALGALVLLFVPSSQAALRELPDA